MMITKFKEEKRRNVGRKKKICDLNMSLVSSGMSFVKQ